MNVTYSASHVEAASHGPTGREVGQLFALLRMERRDLWVVLIYGMLAGLLSLVLPLVSQAIVNTVAFGVFTPNLWVLCALALLGLLLVGAVVVLQRWVVDVLQRRLLVRTAFDIAHRLPRIREDALAGRYAPELVNRFFDVLTLQKTTGKLLLDGVSAALTVVFGLILLALYHPFYLILDVVILAFLPVLALLGRNGLATSIAESERKYAVANWLEEVARCRVPFKRAGVPDHVVAHADELAVGYVRARRAHFAVVARQLIGTELFRALMIVGALGLGGVLVIQQQLSLGQFVAAEVVVLYLGGALQKLVARFEDLYDLLTSLHKIEIVTALPAEPEDGRPVVASARGPASLVLSDVFFAYPGRPPVLDGASVTIAAGERVSLVGRGKSSLASLVTRLWEPTSGLIELDGVDVRTIDHEDLRVQVGVIEGRRDQIFEGTIEENITMGRPLSYAAVRWAVATAQLAEEIVALPAGLRTHVPATGAVLSESVCTRLLCARAIVARPRLLVVDDALAGLPPDLHERLLRALWGEPAWTLIDLSQDPRLVRRADRVLVLQDGRIQEQAAPREERLDG